MKFTKITGIVAAAALSLATFAVAEGGNEDQLISQTADAHIVQGLQIEQWSPSLAKLNFGKLSKDNDVPTTCYMAPDGSGPSTFIAGAANTDGNCTGETETYVGSAPSDGLDTISLAHFKVTGEPLYAYRLNIKQPANTDVLTITSGANSMTITLFGGGFPDGVESSNGLANAGVGAWDGALPAGGLDDVHIGGTLSIAAAQASGHYAGTYDLDVLYN